MNQVDRPAVETLNGAVRMPAGTADQNVAGAPATTGVIFVEAGGG